MTYEKQNKDTEELNFSYKMLIETFDTNKPSMIWYLFKYPKNYRKPQH